MAVLELELLTKRYGNAVAAANELSATIAHGSLVCLLGPSGCGKTTALRLVAGFMAPDGGTIRVGERVLSRGQRPPPERRNMSMIFQSYALWPHMSIAENVALRPQAASGCAGRDRAARQHHPRCDASADRAGRYPADISGGQQQRVALAARARGRAGDPAARRAALEPRRQSARGDALRDPPAARRLPLHHALRHPRPGRGDDHRRPHRGDEPGRVEQTGRPRRSTSGRARNSSRVSSAAPTSCAAESLGNGLVDCGGVVVRCGEGEYAPRARRWSRCGCTISPRLSAQAAADSAERGRGRVERQTYLGAQRDYLVTLTDGQPLRVVTPLSVDMPVGGRVVAFPPEHCRALAHEAPKGEEAAMHSYSTAISRWPPSAPPLPPRARAR